MFRMKKFVSIVICLAMVVTLFAGCGKSENKTTETSDDTSKEETNKVTDSASKEDSEPVTIVWYRLTYSDASANQQVEDAINAYIEPKIGVKVQMESISSGDYKNKLTLDLAANQQVDLFWTASWLGSNDLMKSNAVMDITDLLQNYPDLYNSMPEKVWNSSEFNGKNYFIPMYKETGTGYSYMTSAELANELGWDVSQIKKFSDLEPYLEDAKNAGVKYPLAVEAGDLFQIEAMDDIDFISGYAYAGIEINGDTTKIINTLETQQFKDFINMMYRWNQAGYISEDLVQGGLDSTKIQQAIADKTAGFTQFTTIPNVKEEASRRVGTQVEIAPVTSNWLNSNSALGSMYGISSATKNADACLGFLQLLNTDTTLADLCTYGIEGVNYTRDDKGKVVLTENSGFNYGLWQSANVNAASLLTSDSDNKKQDYEEFNASAQPAPSLGFRFDVTGYEAEVASVQSVYSEYYLLLNRGFVEPGSGLATFNEALEKAGINDILNAIQSQYDEFLASK